MRSNLPLLLSVVTASSVACTKDEHHHEPATYHATIKPLMDAKCVYCHEDEGIAPFALDDLEQIRALAVPIRDAIVDRRMPPWLAGPDCNEYVANRALSDEELDTMVRWLDGGMPEGDTTDEPITVDREVTALSRVDLSLAMPEPYVPQKMPDDYRCFLLDWPYADPTFVTGFAAIPGNTKIVHHIIAFLISPDSVPTYQALDDAEDGPGYTCFGGPGGTTQLRGGMQGGLPVSMMGGWAPGGNGNDFPAGTGLEVAPGSKIALQVHYNTSPNNEQRDTSSIRLRIDQQVDRPARIIPFTNPTWPQQGAMMIPAGDPDVTHRFAFDPTGFLTEGEAFVVHSATLHMHRRGQSGALRIDRQGAPDSCLLDIPAWDFDWQGSYTLREPVTFEPGDEMSIECNFDNSSTDHDVTWGEGTDDEMCIGFFYTTDL